MEFLVFGVNHRTAPVEVRERWSLSHDQSRRQLESLREQTAGSEHLILSTCNRTEFYARIPKSRAQEQIEPTALADFFFGADHQLADDDIEHAYVYRERAAVEHLFRLAGGLDSMIVGESEILKQIKDAFSISCEAQTVGHMFHRLFPAALSTGKRVRSMTEISKGCITPGHAALQLARESLGDLAKQKVLLVGSGKIATLTARALADQGVTHFEIANRTPERAKALAAEFSTTSTHATIIPWDEFPAALGRASLVVSSTGSTRPLVDADLLSRVRADATSPLMAVDLAIPRDFHPEVRDLEGVQLYNIDDLNQVIHANVEQRHAQVPQAESIVREQIHAFVGRMSYMVQVEPVIRHMYERFEEMRLGELQACIDDFPEEFHGQLNGLTRSLVNKILNFPIARLKALRDLGGLSDEEVKFLRKLFPTDPS